MLGATPRPITKNQPLSRACRFESGRGHHFVCKRLSPKRGAYKVSTKESRDSAMSTYLSNKTIANRNALAAQHYKLICEVLWHHLRVPSYLQNDAFQEGFIGLCRAIEKFDPAKGSFSHYAILWIKAYVVMWMEKDIRETRCVTMNKDTRYRKMDDVATVTRSNRTFGYIPRGSDDDKNTYNIWETIPDTSPGPEENFVSRSAVDKTNLVFSSIQMNERELAIVKDHIFNDVPLHSLGDAFGVSGQRMHQIKSALLERMKAVLCK